MCIRVIMVIGGPPDELVDGGSAAASHIEALVARLASSSEASSSGAPCMHSSCRLAVTVSCVSTCYDGSVHCRERPVADVDSVAQQILRHTVFSVALTHHPMRCISPPPPAGDNKSTAESVGRQIGLLQGGGQLGSPGAGASVPGSSSPSLSGGRGVRAAPRLLCATVCASRRRRAGQQQPLPLRVWEWLLSDRAAPTMAQRFPDSSLQCPRILQALRLWPSSTAHPL